MTAATYAIYGLRVHSDVPLAAPPASGSSRDLEVRLGAPGPVAPEPAAGRLLAEQRLGGAPAAALTAAASGGYVLRFFRQAEFRIASALDRITVHPDPAAPAGFHEVLLAGSALAFVLCLRGATVLHASAVEHRGRLVGLLGASGQGKSSLAARLCAGGTRLVTDDVLRVSECDGRLVGWPGTACLRLREGAVATAAVFPERARAVTPDRRTAVYPETAGPGPLPLGALTVPHPDRGLATPRFRRLEPVEALTTLLRYPRVVGWCDNEVAARDFRLLARIADSVPVWAARVPWGARFLPEAADRLIATVAE